MKWKGIGRSMNGASERTSEDEVEHNDGGKEGIEGVKELNRQIEEMKSTIEELEVKRDALAKENVYLKSQARSLNQGPAPGRYRRDEMFRSNQRSGILVDVQNMYYAARSIYNAKLSYDRLMNIALRGRALARAIAYVVQREGAEQSGFLEILRSCGFEIKILKISDRGESTRRIDWNVGIALDALAMSEKVDVISLVSGEGSLAPLIRALRSRGTRVEVIAFPESTTEEMRESADEFVSLDEGALYREEDFKKIKDE